MDGRVCQGLKAALVLQAGQEYQDLLGTMESKVSLVQGEILEMMEIWEIKGLREIQAYQVYQDFQEPRVSLDSLMDNQAHQDPKDCQGRMDPLLPEGVQEFQGTQDTREDQDSLDNQALLGNQEDKEDQATQDLVAHQVLQVLQVFQVIMEVRDH